MSAHCKRQFFAGSALAIALLALLGHAAPAAAAYNQNSARSNHAKAGLAEGEGGSDSQAELDAKVAELNGKIDELDALLASIQEQAGQAAALKEEINTLNQEAIVLTGQVTKDRKDMLQWFDDRVRNGRQVFDEQIAPLLDPEVVDSVHKSLDAAVQYQESDLKQGQPEGTDNLENFGGLGDNLAAMQSSVDAVKNEIASLKLSIKRAYSSGKFDLEVDG